MHSVSRRTKKIRLLVINNHLSRRRSIFRRFRLDTSPLREIQDWVTFYSNFWSTFQFRTQPSEYWDGIIDGEVLIVEAPNRVSYTWASGGEMHTVT